MTMKHKKPRPMKFEVNSALHSRGPQFSSITEACRYIAHCMSQDSNQSMTIHKL